jgi:phenylalanine-4-hydroxylase
VPGEASVPERRTVLIRPREVMDYLPEPDVCRDVSGHVPCMRAGCSRTTCRRTGVPLECEDERHIKRLGRLFWFTVEFGLIREGGRTKVSGAGLVSTTARRRLAGRAMGEQGGEHAGQDAATGGRVAGVRSRAGVRDGLR